MAQRGRRSEPLERDSPNVDDTRSPQRVRAGWGNILLGLTVVEGTFWVIVLAVGVGLWITEKLATFF